MASYTHSSTIPKPYMYTPYKGSYITDNYTPSVNSYNMNQYNAAVNKSKYFEDKISS